RFVFVTDEQTAVRRKRFRQAAERALEMLEIAVNVRVVELDARENRLLGFVVEKLRPLVEKRRVVLVAFEHDPVAAPLLKSAGEIPRHAADEKARLPSRLREHPSHERRSRRLAVRAGDDQRALRADEKLSQRLRKRDVRRADAQHLLDL